MLSRVGVGSSDSSGRALTPVRPSPPRRRCPRCRDTECCGAGRDVRIAVVDVAGDGTGPWRLMVNGYGVAQWQHTGGAEYAAEVARVLRKAVDG